ncbi:NUDIX hydrolase [Shewanella psychropiezotolerans]|uniref:Phosphatase NudJ n=1 Tax=Shewanella psychropiezotolerans TaxID=2593655 RepID=A0ABX5WXK2_9GAMM|nr:MULTISPECIES: NUDIX hydrolase [Shewanella]MPY24775.1 NUDIX hydrolase [Shewanella sp. YLB-07]QDO83831.1 NUDIX hydrolase [Shewanella psychropiezotolerans]
MTPRYRPNVTVACIIESQGKYLIVEELIQGQRRYNQPAGHLELGESLLQACQREVREETGLEIIPQGLTGIYQFSANESLTFLRFTFHVTLEDCAQTQPQDPIIQDTHWLTYAEISALGSRLRSPLVLSCIDDFLNKIHYPLEVLNDDYLKLAPNNNA